MSIQVFYHASCTDGMAAATLFHTPAAATALALDKDATPITTPINYGFDEHKLVIEDDVDEVYFVDFCPTPAQLVYLMDKYPDTIFTIIDHHKTSYDALNDWSFEADSSMKRYLAEQRLIIFIDMLYSGAMLTFMYFELLNSSEGTRLQSGFSDGLMFENLQCDIAPFDLDDLYHKAPRTLKLVCDRDMWTKKYDQTEDFAAGLRETSAFSRADIFAIYQLLFSAADVEVAAGVSFDDLRIRRICRNGNVINKANSRHIELIMNNGLHVVECDAPIEEATFSRFGAANVPAWLASNFGALACTQHKLDFCVMWTDNPKTNKRNYSFRSADGFDVGLLAKLFGGGGHEAASGCQMSLDEAVVDQLLKIKDMASSSVMQLDL